MNRQRLWIGLIAATIVQGCMVGPNYRTPETPAPKAWSGVKAHAPTSQPSRPTTQPAHVTEWWKTLHDPMLESLLAQAVDSNLDLQVATARVLQARATRGVVAADLWPQLNSSGSYAYRGGSLNAGPKTKGGLSIGKQVRNTAINTALQTLTTGQAPVPPLTTPGTFQGIVGQAVTNAVNRKLATSGIRASRDSNLFQAGFDASWELDVFGGTRRAVEAADADIVAAEENRNEVLITLLSDVAANYTQLRGSQRQLVIARENIRVQKDTLELTQSRRRVGFVSELDVDQAQAQLANTQSQVPLLLTAIRQAIYQLSVLLGRTPEALLAQLEREGPIPAIPPEVPVGLPSELLRRRPDVRFAEAQLAAATARIGVATADLFPKFALTGSIGPQVRDIRHFFDAKSMAWSVGPGVTWPVFDGWRIRSNIQLANAQEQELLATYEKTVLVAFQDVENALVAYTNEQLRYRSLTEAVAASQRSADLSQELYSRGLTAFINVLQAQTSLYALQEQLVMSETNLVTDLISLYKALGGGWIPPEDDAGVCAAS